MDGQRQRRARRPAGFTLVELIGVVALVVVLSIAAIPAIGAITRARQSATVAESARLITAARQRAMATSRPAGVEIDLTAQSLSLLHLQEPSLAPMPISDAAGHAIAFDITNTGAAIEQFHHGDGANGSGAIWFTGEGRPALRRQDGSFIDIGQDAALHFTGGFRITIRRLTGAIER